MVDRTYTVKGKQDARVLQEFMGEAEMSQNDTVTLGEFTLSTNLLQAWLVNSLTGALLTSTISNNQITMTNAGTGLRVTIFAFGVKA